MIVTSLPISYKVDRPHRVLVSPYITSLLARMTGAKAFFPINIMSLRGEKWGSVAEGIATYRKALETVGYVRPVDHVMSDASPELIEYAQQCVQKAVSEGVCEFRTENISTCPCSRVEILTHVIDELAESNQLQLITGSSGQYFCKICTAGLSEKLSLALIYQQGAATPPTVWPSIHQKRLSEIVGGLGGKTYLVSRSLHSRKYAASVGEALCLDPDFLSAIYLRYLSETEKDEEVTLVVSATHVYRGSRAIAAANSLGSPIHFRLVVHPIFDFAAGNTTFSRKTSSTEFLELLGSTAALKLFQATMLQWGRLESYCNVGDLPLLTKTVPSLLEYASKSTVLPLDEALGLLNRNQLLSTLKKVRKSKVLSEEEKCLLASLL